jgi:hypothetical protein
LEVLAAQLRALGALRERRSIEDVKLLLFALEEEGVSSLSLLGKSALEQRSRPSFAAGSESLVVNMVLEALLLLPLKS